MHCTSIQPHALEVNTYLQPMALEVSTSVSTHGLEVNTSVQAHGLDACTSVSTHALEVPCRADLTLGSVLPDLWEDTRSPSSTPQLGPPEGGAE